MLWLLKSRLLQAGTPKLLHQLPGRVRGAYGPAANGVYLQAKLHSFLPLIPTEHGCRSGAERAGIGVTSTRLYTCFLVELNPLVSTSKLLHSVTGLSAGRLWPDGGFQYQSSSNYTLPLMTDPRN